MLEKAAALTLVSISSLFLAFLLAAALSRARSGSRTGAFAGLSAACLVYAAGYLLELISPNLQTILVIIRVEYLGIVLVSPFLLLVVRVFEDDEDFRISTPLLFVVPALTLGLVLTMGWHDLYYVNPSIEKVSGLTILHFGKGPGYWLFEIYQTLAIAYGVFIFARNTHSGPRSKRIQARYMLAGSLLPWIGNLLYMASLIPLGLDPTPISLSLGAGFFAIVFFRYRLFDLRPIARDAVFEQMRDAVLVTDERGIIVDHNTAAVGIFPILSGTHGIRNIRDLAPDAVSFLDAMTGNGNDTVVSLPSQAGERKYALHHSVLSYRSGDPSGTAHVFMDITERLLMEERLKILASTDELTGVANRRHFFEQARAELERAQRYGRPFGVAILDLNDFKLINDRYGHPAGDEALRQAAKLCGKALRTTDLMGRYGGDEFAFAFPECDENSAREAAARLAAILASSVFSYENKPLQVTASVGSAGASAPTLPSLEELLKRADDDMYHKKARQSGETYRGSET